MIDGHIHSPFCPHGSSDSLKTYVEKAITLGYKKLTFTEHAPLPPSFKDPAPNEDSGMSLDSLERYINEVKKVKKEYEADVDVKTGLEVDYIAGYEDESREFLNTYGRELDDSILSVHFIKGKSQWYCIDYSPEMYEAALKDFNSNTSLYSSYFEQVRASILSDLGPYKPTRIGHMTLVKKFQLLFPPPSLWEKEALTILKLLKETGYSLDYNGAGTKKPHCKETYPPIQLAERAYSLGIPLIYGSDAHTVSGLKQGYDEMDETLLHFR